MYVGRVMKSLLILSVFASLIMPKYFLWLLCSLRSSSVDAPSCFYWQTGHIALFYDQANNLTSSGYKYTFDGGWMLIVILGLGGQNSFHSCTRKSWSADVPASESKGPSHFGTHRCLSYCSLHFWQLGRVNISNQSLTDFIADPLNALALTLRILETTGTINLHNFVKTTFLLLLVFFNVP